MTSRKYTFLSKFINRGFIFLRKMKKNILSILDVQDEIEEIIDFGIKLKSDIKTGRKFDYLENKIIALIFERASTRTRVSFEVGTQLLGGQTLFLSKNDLQLGRGETIEDTALVLSRYVDIIMYRAINKDHLLTLAKYATVPVINGLDINEHPCQILADLMTIKEYKKTLVGLNFVFVGDGDDNLAHSYLLGCPLVGMNVTIISKKKYWPKRYFIKESEKIASRNHVHISITEDIHSVKDADILATDTWVSFWYEQKRRQILKELQEYTITQEIMKFAKPDSLFLHCMPIYYDEEVVKEVAHGPQSVILDEAENRMWVQMALMSMIVHNQECSHPIIKQ
jgi:ornithine carbamoyltransferase